QYVMYFTACYVFFLYSFGAHRALHSFPTRRSSDLLRDGRLVWAGGLIFLLLAVALAAGWQRHAQINSERSAGQALDYDAWLQQRSEEHTSELQSRENIVCRLLLEKKKNTNDAMAEL